MLKNLMLLAVGAWIGYTVRGAMNRTKFGANVGARQGNPGGARGARVYPGVVDEE